MWRGRGGGDTGGQPPSWRNASRPFLPRPSIVWRGRGGGEGVERAPSSHATLRPSRSPPRIIWRGREGGQSPGLRNEPDDITNNEIKTPCIQFLKGTCTYGAACRFSHDINNTVPEPDARPSFPKEDEETREAYKAWRSLLRKDTQSFYGSGSLNHASKLWKGALRILDSDNQEQHHELARDLVNEEFHGPEWITLTSKISKFSDMTELLCVEKFLQVITHPSIKPLSIDSFVGIMFLLLGGTNGEQGIDLLSNMCLKLGQVIEKSEEPNSNQIQEVVDVVLKTLLELLTKIQRAQLSDHVPQLLKSLDTLVEWIADSASRNQIDSLKARLDIIKRVVAGSLDRVVAAALSSGNKNKNKKTRCTTSTFPREAEIPGGRHDNDFADILDISILPTQGEVISEHAEYLPSTNFLHPHVLEDPMQRYVDSTFRLVRHDTLGLVNDALRDVLAMEDVGAIRVSEKNSQAHVYQSSTILNVWVHEKKGLEFQVSLLPPNFLLKKSFDDQRDWWQRSPRLGEGTLICFVSSRNEGQRLLFLNVTKKSTQEDPVGDSKKGTLVSQLNMSSITAKLATHEQSDLALLLQLWREGTQGVLVDFNGIIPETFMPILKNLQAIKEENHIAFQNWILPSPEENDRMQPPLYARKPGFVFPLGCIAKTGDRNLLVDPSAKLEDIDLDEIENATGLDHGQCLGLVEALTREYALIQGPPGTGKSYLGVQLVRSLLAVKERAKLGPIVIICYTNHALDQFLEHLLGVGIEKIIRIGGRSVSEQLDGKNLRVVSKETPKTRVESQILGKTYKEQDSALKAAENALSPIHESRKGSGWDAIERHLMQEYPEIHQQFRRVDDEGFQTVSKDPFRAWLGPEPPLTGDWERPIMEIISSAELSAYRLTSMERWRFVMYLFDELKERQLEMLHESLEDFETKRETIRKTHEALAQRTLTRADVIGITTTALAGRIEMLRSLRFKVVVCEEAGELKESDLISALKSGVEHFIQIGDHKQLRPQINNFDLSLESSTGQRWQLDRSQFERRAVGEPGLAPAPFAQLNVQRRMRPEISRLIRRVYPDLEDHDSVGDLPDVVGMGKNLFWLDHNHPEDDGGDGTRVKSHSNKWETDMTTALVRHLVRQGTYKPEDIALLTPYTGQLQQLRATLRRDFEVCLSDRDMDRLAHEGFDDESTTNETNKPSEGPQKMVEKKQLLQSIRIATVDNFQGEEAKVIIVSLVRSNAKRNVGFLRTENRINVLLSRAKHGMYLIGNSETYLNVAMWTDVYNQLMKAAAVGREIELCCPRHKDTPIFCSEPEDFAIKSPEGGCILPCSRRLEPCGHRCQARCHSDVMHDAFFCQQPCPRIRKTCDHACPKLCGEQCGSCMVRVKGVKLPCGHAKTLKCYMKQDLGSVRCTDLTEKVVIGCLHTVTVPCYRDVDAESFSCPAPCTHILPCGHQCPGSCSECNKPDGSAQHRACTTTCDRPFGPCNHRCGRPCHSEAPCGSCPEPCEVRCPHSSCASPCNKACAPCIEPCTWSCPHQGSCSLPCSAPCDRLPCERRCTKLLSCGHQCPSFCGEDCPTDHCQKCSDKGEARVDLLEFKSYAEIDLEESPIVVLGCGHFFTGETLDGMIGLGEVYTVDRGGNFDGLKDVSGSLSWNVPFCPDCKRPIRQFATKRYNRLINRAVMDEICKRFLITGRETLERLEQRLHTAEDELNTSRVDHELIDGVGVLPKKGRYLELEALRNLGKGLAKRMGEDHQPTKVLIDAIATSRRRTTDDPLSITRQMEALQLSPPAPDSQIILGAQLVAIKSQEVQLQDAISILKQWRDDTGTDSDLMKLWLEEQHLPSMQKFFATCIELIEQAKDFNLPRTAIAATLAFARVSQLFAWRVERNEDGHISKSDEEHAENVEERTNTARELLNDALDQCYGIRNSEELQERVAAMLQLFEPHYSEVTPEELASIKSAMVSGRDGMATNSGHWYRCTNGHPFAIGECGMPMELAQCPECGATIGGEDHEAVEGVYRAEDME